MKRPAVLLVARPTAIWTTTSVAARTSLWRCTRPCCTAARPTLALKGFFGIPLRHHGGDRSQRTAVLGGCTQKCLGGAVEVSGGVVGRRWRRGGRRAVRRAAPTRTLAAVTLRSVVAQLHLAAVAQFCCRAAQRAAPSGEVLVRTETSGNDGVSGEISVETGASAVGDSGGITLATGSAMTGAGGT